MSDLLDSERARISEANSALARIHELIKAASDVARSLDSPLPLVLGLRTALRVALAELALVRALLMPD